MKKQIIIIAALLGLCLVAGVVLPSIDKAEALAPVGQSIENFLYHLNQIQ